MSLQENDRLGSGILIKTRLLLTALLTVPFEKFGFILVSFL